MYSESLTDIPFYTQMAVDTLFNRVARGSAWLQLHPPPPRKYIKTIFSVCGFSILLLHASVPSFYERTR